MSQPRERCCAEVREQRKFRAVGELPMCGKAGIAENFVIGAESTSAVKMRHNVPASQFQKFTIEAKPLPMIGLRNHSPVKARGLERCRDVGIGYCCAARWVIEASEFIAASRRNGFRQTFLKIAEEEEWCFR